VIIISLPFAELDSKVHHLILSGHRLSTTTVYNSIQKGYFAFCQSYQLTPLPLSESLFLRFIAYKAPTVGYNSFNVYLAALRALHTCNYLPPPPANTPRIKLTLKALELQASAPNKKAPITIQQLCSIMSVLPNDFDTLAIWSVITMAFFGCFRAGELVVTPGRSQQVTPRINDISFGFCNNIMYMQLVVKCSKTKPHGFIATIGCSGHMLCAVCTVIQYLHQKGITHTRGNVSTLFTLANGVPITKPFLASKLKQYLLSISVDPTNYSPHSLRIGCASLAGQLGFSPFEIRDLGKWASDAYLGYIHPPLSHSAAYSSRLLCPLPAL